MEFPALSQTIDHESLPLLAAMTFGIQIIAMKGCQITSIKGEVVVSASLSPRLILSFIYHHSPMRQTSEPYHILISDQQPTECCKRFVLCC